MLDLTGHSSLPKRHITPVNTPAVTGPTLAELQAHVATRIDISTKTQDRYLSAIERVGLWLWFATWMEGDASYSFLFE